MSKLSMLLPLVCLTGLCGPASSQVHNVFKPMATRESLPSMDGGNTTRPTQSVTYGAFLAHGLDGLDRWRTVVDIMNTSNVSCAVTVEFFDYNGNPISLPFSDGNGHYTGHFPMASAVLDPGVYAYLTLIDYNENVLAGYIRITTQPGLTLGADITVGRLSGFTATAFVETNVPATTDSQVLGIVDGPGQETTVSLVNPGSAPADVTVITRNSLGNPACTENVHLAAGQQIWTSVSSLTHCVGANLSTLNVTAVNGPILLGAFWNQSGVGFAAAPLHRVFNFPAPAGQ